MYKSWGIYRGGGWHPANGGVTPVVNPVTEEVIGEAPAASAEDAQQTIDAAVEGFRQWRQVPAIERGRLLRAIARKLEERKDELARWLTLELGKPLAQSQGEVQMAVEQFDWYAEETRRIYGQVYESRLPQARVFIQQEPVGVVAAFTAWNFPVILSARKLAPALAAGCSVILRPAEEAPGALYLFFECMHEVGLPAGAVNLLTGLPDSISPVLLADARVRKLTLTGSTRVGKLLLQGSAQTLKRTSMELGGHAPVIVFADADALAIAEQAAQVKFKHCGQVCASPTRYYIHESQVEAFTERFLEVTKTFRLGDGQDPSVEIGPLATAKRREEVEDLVARTVASGARLRLGGQRPPQFERGFFYEPTVLDQVPDHAPIMHEEPFGPVVPITSFREWDEVVARANDNEYGLTSYVFTRSQRLAQQTADALEAGMVGVNTFALATAETPYGGIKQSGYGREGGAQGIQDYLQTKYINQVMVD